MCGGFALLDHHSLGNRQFLFSLFTDSLFSLQRSSSAGMKIKTARDLFIARTRGFGESSFLPFFSSPSALALALCRNGRKKEVYGQVSCSCNLSYGFVVPLRDKNTRRNLAQHHPKGKFRFMIISRTSRCANVLLANVVSRFANEFGQFPCFFRLINGLKNKVYTCVSDILASGLKEGGIYMYCACIVSSSKRL